MQLCFAVETETKRTREDTRLKCTYHRVDLVCLQSNVLMVFMYLRKDGGQRRENKGHGGEEKEHL